MWGEASLGFRRPSGRDQKVLLGSPARPSSCGLGTHVESNLQVLNPQIRRPHGTCKHLLSSGRMSAVGL